MKQNNQTAADIRARLRVAGAEELAVLERALAADERITVHRALEAARKRLAAQQAEQMRLRALYEYERSIAQGLVLGIDEVGRGPLAGPLAVGGVVLPNAPFIELLNDSKQIPSAQRAFVAQAVHNVALVSTIVFVDASQIDSDGMSCCLRFAVRQVIRDIEATGLHPDTVLLDGLALHVDERETAVVKGDAQCASIAAASVIAKEARDALMREFALTYPGYGFERNKGYASSEHTSAIRRLGLCPIHRRTFCSAFLQESLF